LQFGYSGADTNVSTDTTAKGHEYATADGHGCDPANRSGWRG
jgi:hypothetical protein